MLYVDAKFAQILGSRLRNFKKTKDYTWNFSCPVCGDSTRNKLKARGYIYQMKSDLMVKCHKCGYSTNLGNLIKYVDVKLYDEYVLERYKNGATRYHDHKSIADTQVVLETTKEELLEDDILESLTRMDKLPLTHPAMKILIDRKIPKDKWNLLYFAPKFKAFVNSVTPKFQEPIVDEHPRLIIPFFTPAGKCFAFQGRAFGDEQPKYYTIKVDETEEKIYGLDRVDFSKRIYVVEGPIDSLFLPNAVAVSGSSFDTPTVRQLLTNATLVMDNEPRSKEITKLLEKNIKAGYSVCMFPEHVTQKDINEMFLHSGMSIDEIVETINTNTFSGIEATLRFSTWRKI